MKPVIITINATGVREFYDKCKTILSKNDFSLEKCVPYSDFISKEESYHDMYRASWGVEATLNFEYRFYLYSAGLFELFLAYQSYPEMEGGIGHLFYIDFAGGPVPRACVECALEEREGI